MELSVRRAASSPACAGPTAPRLRIGGKNLLAKAVLHFPQFQDLAALFVPCASSQEFIVPCEFEPILDFGGGFDAYVDEPPEFAARGRAATFDELLAMDSAARTI